MLSMLPFMYCLVHQIILGVHAKLKALDTHYFRSPIYAHIVLLKANMHAFSL